MRESRSTARIPSHPVVRSHSVGRLEELGREQQKGDVITSADLIHKVCSSSLADVHAFVKSLEFF